MDDEDAVDKVLLAWLLCLIGGGCLIALLVGLNGCGGQQLTTSDATTALKLAVCVEQAIQDESEQRKQRVQQLLASPDVQQVQKEQLNDATKSDAGVTYRVPSSVGHEVEQMMRVRDAGVM